MMWSTDRPTAAGSVTPMMGPRQKAAEDEIERDIAEWPGPQDAEAYRVAMRKTTAYQLALLSDAMRAFGMAAASSGAEAVRRINESIERNRRP